MVRVSLFFVAFISLQGATAFAQATPTWSGFYIGLDGAALSHNGRQDIVVNDPLQSLSGQGQNSNQAVLFPNSVGASGVTAAIGAHILYEQQFGSLVAGGLIDFVSFTKPEHGIASRSLHDPSQAYPDYVGTTNGSVKTRWVSTARARLGYSLDRVLPYIDGGFVAVRSNAATNLTISDTGNPPPDFYSGSRSRITHGYAIGAGMQYALSQHFVLGADYMYYRAGSLNYKSQPDPFTDGDQPSVTHAIHYKVYGNVLRASIEYKF